MVCSPILDRFPQLVQMLIKKMPAILEDNKLRGRDLTNQAPDIFDRTKFIAIAVDK